MAGKKMQRKKAVKRPYKKRAYKPRKNNLVKTIKQVIHSQIENKQVGATVLNQAIAYAGSLTTPTLLNMMPTVSTGVLEGVRIGNEINVVKATLRGRVNLLPYNVTSNPSTCPIMIKMWLCRRKSSNLPIGGIPSFTKFFQSSGIDYGFQANMLDTLYFPNREAWTILGTKTIELCNSNGITFGGANSVLPGASRVSAPFTFSFAQHLGKLKYDDSVNTPTNKELYLVFQSVLMDGSTPLVGSFAEFHAVTEWEYEDA